MDNEQSSEKKTFLTENFKWMVITIMIPATTAIVGFFQQEIAKQERDASQRREAIRSNVVTVTQLLPALAGNDTRQAALAFATLRHLNEAQDDDRLKATYEGFLSQVDGLIVKPVLNDPNASPEQKAGAVAIAEQVANVRKHEVQTKQPATEIAADQQSSSSDLKIPSLVYLQIFDENQRGQAENIRTSFRSKGVPVPGIENVSRILVSNPSFRMPPQVRYFSPSDAGAARWAAEAAETVTKDRWTIVRIKTKQAVPPGQIEIWFNTANPPGEG